MSRTGPRISRRARADDDAVATVVGFVLVLAAVVTYFGFVARNDVPEWGAEAEQDWDRDVGDALVRLGQSAGESLGAEQPVSGFVPPAPEPRSLSVPLL